MEALLKEEFGYESLKTYGHGGGGCISAGHSYETDKGRIFVKVNGNSEARRMFDGEYASLEALVKTDTVRVPKPIKVLDSPRGGACFVMEHLEMTGLGHFGATLGEQLARLHLHNEEHGRRLARQESSLHKEGGLDYISKFGFHQTTCCGYLPQDNTWEDDWVNFFIRHRLQYQIDMIEREYNDAEARTLWGKLMPIIPSFYKDITVKPSLLHGDLWAGNVSATRDGPVIYDPASFYGHSEYEMGIATMFGGLDSDFFSAYHAVIPKAPDFDRRLSLYQLFHYLNHWNHFGSGYRSQAIRIMKELIASTCS